MPDEITISHGFEERTREHLALHRVLKKTHHSKKP